MADDRQLAIRVQGLGKRYRIGSVPGTGRLYEGVGRLFRGGRRKLGDDLTFWALREVSFEVPAGQVLGVIGRNGSGKSTLMKILARVTAPTEGMAEVRGRVGAMLQVGTGFHPELSGRDNIALSGAILGMSATEIAAVEDQIIEFAEIDLFLDTAVKHYSNGMLLRLAFSVSAHMAAEIMLVDETLSVGDASFQARCLERIRKIVDGGRTVVYVSHDLQSVMALCDSAIVLDQGVVSFNGGTAEAVNYYRSMLGG